MISRRSAVGMFAAPLLAQTRRASPATTPAAATADWPQWHGPDRTNLSKETGLLKQWPTGGPKLLWSVNGLGSGGRDCISSLTYSPVSLTRKTETRSPSRA